MEFSLDKAIEFVKKHKIQLLIIFAIFIIGFGIRAHLMKYDLIFGYDSYYHARIVSYVIEDFTIPQIDPLAYFQMPEGGAIVSDSSWFFWYFSAISYKLFTLGAEYTKESWIFWLKILPALWGALISVGMYFFGREAYGKKAGTAMGLFAATIPAFVYRTMSGFFEEDALGFLWMVLGFIFLVKALKQPEWTKEKIIYAGLAGLFFAIMSWTWTMFLMIPLILIGYFVAQMAWNGILHFYSDYKKEDIFNFVKLFVLMLAIFSVLATINDGGTWIHKTYGYVSDYLPISSENIERLETKGSTVLEQTIGEENTGKQFFFNKYNALVIFPIMFIIFLSWRLFKNPKDNVSFLILFWVLLAFFMAWNKLKFTYVFGLPIAASAGLVFHELFKLAKNRSFLEKQLAGVFMLLMILIGLGAGTFFTSQQFPGIESDNGWKEALYWMQDNLPEDTRLLNWWDTGHWITFIGEKAVMEDNTNYSYEADRDTAKFFLAETENEAMAIVTKNKTNHLIFDADHATNPNSFAVYAYDTTDWSDIRLQKYAGIRFSDGSYLPPARGIDCTLKENAISREKFYQCGSDALPVNEMNSIRTVWTDTPSMIAYDKVPMYIYRATDNSKLFMFNPTINKTMGIRLWFNDPELEHFRQIYSNEKVKIFKVV